jgi:molybdopterin/thiamine biosynthesis adenylyltransferase
MPHDRLAPPGRAQRLTACVVGLGNIGSQLVPLLARGGLGGLTLVDPDAYDARNLGTQNIEADDTGRAKVDVMEALALGIDPSLHVTAIQAAVEDVPLGRLRADLVFSAPDTRQARQHVNRIAWRLGVRAWIDMGIEPAAQLARVSLHVPREGSPCMECAWGPDDYATLASRVTCTGQPDLVPGTNGPPALGALAAAHAALLAREVIAGGATAGGIQIAVAVREHRLVVTSFRRNPCCRFDHEVFALETLARLPVSTPLGDVPAAVASHRVESGWRLAVDGCDFAVDLVCNRCGDARAATRLLRPRSGAGLGCCCGGRYTAPALSTRSDLARDVLTPADLARPLADLGLASGDICVATVGGETHGVELVDAPEATAPRDDTCVVQIRLPLDSFAPRAPADGDGARPTRSSEVLDTVALDAGRNLGDEAKRR